MSINYGKLKLYRNGQKVAERVLFWLGAFLVLAFIVRYTLVFWISILFGIITCFSIIIYLIINDKLRREVFPIRKPSKFDFVNEQAWYAEIGALLEDARTLHEPIIEESFLISETLDDFINLVIKEFIDSWFGNISNSSIFQDSIRQELRHVVRNIKARLSTLDFASVLVFHILPIINDHFNKFDKIVQNIKLMDDTKRTPAIHMENTFTIACQYDKGKIHPGVTMSMDSTNINEKRYLRNKVASILPYILSTRENTNETAISLVREILACTILSKTVQLLGDNDFYNLLIVNFIGDNLKHEEQVKQLRAALEEHTKQQKHELLPKHVRSKSFKHIENYEKLIQNCVAKRSLDEEIFDRALDYISKTETISDLQNIMQFTELQLSKIINDKSRMMNLLLSRLNLLKLKASDKVLKLKDLQEKMGFRDRQIIDFELADVLENSVGLKSFSEFMDSRNRSIILQLWLAIDSIKAPLEDLDIENDGEARLSLSLKFSNLKDIADIYNKFFHNPVLVINPEIFRVVEECVQNHDPVHKLEIYQRARRALFKLQSITYDSMNNSDLPQFKKSKLFLKLLELHTFENTSLQSNPTTAWSVPQNYKLRQVENISDGSHENEVDDVSPAVLNAVEQAFTQIMRNSDSKEGDFVLNSKFGSPCSLDDISDSSSDHPVLTIHLKKDLFGEPSALFNDESINYPNANRNSKLFDDDSEDSSSDTDSIHLASDTQNLSVLNPSQLALQVLLAAPGNLRLAEEISKLTEEIEKLSEQQAILSPLLRKAELTNNVSELKILRKSNIGLDREIRAKELQKQQFIVQENDNSLYGKSRVYIQSYIQGKENGKNFILYIVEVQKFSNDDATNITAGWIVARRFSQFFKLHEYLKSRYLQVGNIKFPKKSVLVLKFQHKQIVEQRKSLLEEYLQELIKIPEVCSNRVFRSFLSSENFNMRAGNTLDGVNNVNFSRLKNSVELVANKLYNGISGKMVQNPAAQYGMNYTNDENTAEYMKEMQTELKQFDDAEQSSGNEKPVFVKPVCDLLISVFKLNTSQSWLRGRALLVILHQVFGNTLQKKVCELVDDYLRAEESILDLLIWSKNTIFPMGKFMEAPEIRNSYQRSTTKHEAKILLQVFMQETCSKIFGLSNTTYAHGMIFKMLQNEFLNKHLILLILDELLDQLFPETNASSSA